MNESATPIMANLDLSESENLMYSTKGQNIKKRVEPGQGAFMLHTQAGFGNFDKKVKHDVEHLKKWLNIILLNFYPILKLNFLIKIILIILLMQILQLLSVLLFLLIFSQSQDKKLHNILS